MEERRKKRQSGGRIRRGRYEREKKLERDRRIRKG